MPDWEHTGARPRYYAPGEWGKDAAKPHPVAPTHNTQGDWLCHTCGEKVRIKVDVMPPDPGSSDDRG